MLPSCCCFFFFFHVNIEGGENIASILQTQMRSTMVDTKDVHTNLFDAISYKDSTHHLITVVRKSYSKNDIRILFVDCLFLFISLPNIYLSFFQSMNYLESCIPSNIGLANLISKQFTITSDELPTWLEQSKDLILRIFFPILTCSDTLSFNFFSPFFFNFYIHCFVLVFFI